MKTTLQQLVITAKSRKGKAYEITEQGAYWLPVPAIQIHSFGGDGIGQSEFSREAYLELRHYRDGTVRIAICYYSRHQNYGCHSEIKTPASLKHVENVEEIVIALKNHTVCDGEYPAFSDHFLGDLTEALTAFGLPEYPIPSPDEDEPSA